MTGHRPSLNGLAICELMATMDQHQPTDNEPTGEPLLIPYPACEISINMSQMITLEHVGIHDISM